MELTTEMALVSTDTDCTYLKEEMEKILAEWNGKDSGELEDRASVAKEIQEKCDELRNLISELI